MNDPRTRTGRAPVLIPAPLGWGGRENVRALRIRADRSGALVVERPDGTVERRAEPGEVTRVVLADVADAGLPASDYAAGVVSADAHGLLVVLAGDRPVLAVRLAEWLPSPAELDGRTARAVSGANALAAALGRAVEPADARALAGRARAVRAVLVSPRPAVPETFRALLAVGWALLAVWGVASAILRFSSEPRPAAFGWIGAAAAFVLTGTWLVLRRRTSRPLPPPPGVEVAPAPVTPVRAAFRRTRLYVSPDWVVIVDGFGREGWLPGPALGGVTAASVTTEAIVLDDAEGNGLASLPREAWCGAKGSEESLRRVLAAAGLPVRDEPSNRMPGAWLAAPFPMGAFDDPMFSGRREARGVPGMAGVVGGIAGGIVAVGALTLGEYATVAAGGVAAVAAATTWAVGTARERRDGRIA